MSGELVSVVIPTFNYGCFVSEAVDSVLAQTHSAIEVIVVDDGSTDDTAERLSPYGDRIRYLRQDNQGLSGARNTGIRAARGDWIALLDADDVWHPRKLEVQMRYLAEHPEVALLGSGLVTDRSLCWSDVGELSRLEASLVILEEVVVRTRFAPSSVVARKKDLESVGLFDASLRCVEDRDLWIRFVRHFRMAVLPIPLLWYRVHPASLSGKAARMEENEQRVLRRAFAEIPELQRQTLFRMRTFSYVAFNAAFMYGCAGQWGPALGRVLLSLALWPWPFGRDEVDRVLARPRMFGVYLLRMVGLMPPDPAY
jgi:glycosyltransferase involved in cell wall biosynthesis